MIRVIIRIDIDQIVEIGECHLEVELSMAKPEDAQLCKAVLRLIKIYIYESLEGILKKLGNTPTTALHYNYKNLK